MKSKKASYIYKFIGLASVAMLLVGWRMGYSGTTQFLAKKNVVMDTVQSGDFVTKVDGYGRLQSVDKRLITASSSAIIDKLFFKPGAKVDADTTIAILVNPELESLFRKAASSLQNAKLKKRQLVLQQQREYLNSESEFAKLVAESEIEALQVDAEQKLAKSGVISDITFKQSQLKLKQLQKRVDLEQHKLDKLKLVHKEAIAIQEDLIKQASDEYDVRKQAVDQLTVRAGLEGVVQTIPVQLGQSIAAGDVIALVGSLSPLVAEIQVPQLQSHIIAVGMKAEINSVNGMGVGIVERIDPVVTDGAVKVDISLEDAKDFKPMQLVDAVIYADVMKGVNSIVQPYGVSESSNGYLFKQTENNIVQRVNVAFGKASDKRIQILSGLDVGDKVIVSKVDVEQSTNIIKLSE